MKAYIEQSEIQRMIYLIRGQKVMLDRDLALLYQVEVKQLKRQVRRNPARFPPDFMFPLSREEHRSLRSQNGTLARGVHAKYLPFAFTEQGVAMLSGVLHSKRAIEVHVAIMRAFVAIRRMIPIDRELARKVAKHEQQIAGLTSDVQQIINLIQPLLDGPARKIQRIGFGSNAPS